MSRFRRRPGLGLTCATCVTFALAPAVNAQEANPASVALTKGKWSLALELPDGGGSSIGLWKMIGERTNLGLQIGIGWLDSEQEVDDQSGFTDTSLWSISLSPTIQRYLSVSGDVAPFLIAGIDFGIGQTRRRSQFSGEPVEVLQNRHSLGAHLGIGVEWFPVSSISVGGHTGLRFSYENFREERTGPDVSGHDIRFNTFNSALLLRIYF